MKRSDADAAAREFARDFPQLWEYAIHTIVADTDRALLHATRADLDNVSLSLTFANGHSVKSADLTTLNALIERLHRMEKI